jgi:Na+/H+ antiporter NhaA
LRQENRSEAHGIEVYAESRWRIVQRLSLVTGAQLAFARRQARIDFASPDVSGIDDSQKYTGFSPKLGLVWEASRLAHEAVSPLARMETLLHPWSAYLVLPLFALANAGVTISLDQLGDALTGQVGLGILLGLVVGAPLGGIALAWVFVRAGRIGLPHGLDWSAIAGVAPLKGIGFTVAIFMAVLAFDDPALQEEAKLPILMASATAGAIGLTALLIRHQLIRRRGA